MHGLDVLPGDRVDETQVGVAQREELVEGADLPLFPRVAARPVVAGVDGGGEWRGEGPGELRREHPGEDVRTPHVAELGGALDVEEKRRTG